MTKIGKSLSVLMTISELDLMGNVENLKSKKSMMKLRRNSYARVDATELRAFAKLLRNIKFFAKSLISLNASKDTT